MWLNGVTNGEKKGQKFRSVGGGTLQKSASQSGDVESLARFNGR